MSYIIKIGSHEVVCSTPAEVHALIEYKPVGVKSGRASVTVPTTDKRLTTARAFLKTLVSDPQGVTSTRLVEALGFKGPKALGGALGYVHEYLAEIKIDPEEVYETQKRSDAKYWIAKDGANAALAALDGK